MKQLRKFRILVLMLGWPLAGTAAPIQTQPALSGDMEVDIVKAKVDGKILMIAAQFRNNGQERANLNFTIDRVYYIVQDTQQKYHVLRDDQKVWLASYQGATIGRSPLRINPGAKQLLWFKFPAPPENVTRIDLNIPGVLPFDKLPINR